MPNKPPTLREFRLRKYGRRGVAMPNEQYKNGIAFAHCGDMFACRQGKTFEVVTLHGEDGGPMMLKDGFATAAEAVDWMQEEAAQRAMCAAEGDDHAE